MTITKELLEALKEYVSGDKVRGTTSSATHLKALSTIAKAESAVSEPVDRTTGWVTPKDHYTVPVLFNPYTGEPRDARDIASDPQGILIVPLGKVEMLATPPAEAKPQWMPIETAMPEPMIPVLVYNGKQVFIEQWWGEDFTFDYTITHWMPLPLPPTASQT